jgi:hypothetical protein
LADLCLGLPSLSITIIIIIQKLLEGKTIAILITNRVNDNNTMQILDEAGATVRTIYLKAGSASGRKSRLYSVNFLSAVKIDALYITGTQKNIDYLCKEKEILDFVCAVYRSGKNIAVDDQGIKLLEKACLNHRLSTLNYHELMEKGIFMHKVSFPTINRFIDAVASDYLIELTEDIRPEEFIGGYMEYKAIFL